MNEPNNDEIMLDAYMLGRGYEPNEREAAAQALGMSAGSGISFETIQRLRRKNLRQEQLIRQCRGSLRKQRSRYKNWIRETNRIGAMQSRRLGIQNAKDERD